MTPLDFIRKWENTQFGERQGAREMFGDICRLVDHPTPDDYKNRDVFTFEKWVPGGFADAYYEDHFVWEFKGKDRDLDEALKQALRYQVHLKTPPLLIVSSFETIRIQTNFPGMETVRHDISLLSLEQREQLEKLRRVFHAPAEFRPSRSVEAVTEAAANAFRGIVADMERRGADPEKLARYLNQIVFCLYAQDAGLLPDKVFSEIIRQHFKDSATFDRAVRNLFSEMTGGGLFGAAAIRHFNGDLFNATDTIELSSAAQPLQGEATQRNWRNIEPNVGYRNHPTKQTVAGPLE